MLLSLAVSVLLSAPPAVVVDCQYADDIALGARWVEVLVSDGSELVVMETEVTRSQWTAVMGRAPEPWSCREGSCPVTGLTPFDMMAFANRVSEIEGLDRCYDFDACVAPFDGSIECGHVPRLEPGCAGFRLPTYAELLLLMYRRYGLDADYGWKIPREARASLLATGWLAENSSGVTHSVAQRLASALGLFDLVGNVSEVVVDPVPMTPNADGLSPWALDASRVGTVGGNYTSEMSLRDPGARGAAIVEIPSHTAGLRLMRTFGGSTP